MIWTFLLTSALAFICLVSTADWLEENLSGEYDVGAEQYGAMVVFVCLPILAVFALKSLGDFSFCIYTLKFIRSSL